MDSPNPMRILCFADTWGPARFSVLHIQGIRLWGREFGGLTRIHPYLPHKVQAVQNHTIEVNLIFFFFLVIIFLHYSKKTRLW